VMVLGDTETALVVCVVRPCKPGGKNISVFVASPTGLLEILQERGRRAARRRAAFRTLQQLEFVYPAGAPK